MSTEDLLRRAGDARDGAYAPYSSFRVGAALECEDGEVFVGCNVENLSFGLTMCAERVAVGAAIAARNRKFSRLLILADTKQAISPCGACRQVLAEFHPNLAILSATTSGLIEKFDLSVLLPRASTGILDRP